MRPNGGGNLMWSLSLLAQRNALSMTRTNRLIFNRIDNLWTVEGSSPPAS